MKNNSEKIKLVKIPRYTSAPDEDCIWTLEVNGFDIGSYYGGKIKHYLNPEKWAEKQIKQRNVVLNRNIARLKIDLAELEKEREAINQ